MSGWWRWSGNRIDRQIRQDREVEEGDREMTDQERRDIKTKLIEMGIWGEHETGDPLTSKEDAWVVQNRLEERLADTVFVGSRGYVGGSPARHIDVARGEFSYRLADGDNYQEAICLAALALPEFLGQHPECVAGDQELIEVEIDIVDDSKKGAAK
jgi:hypothetical protein